jgi:hypothetical protein
MILLNLEKIAKLSFPRRRESSLSEHLDPRLRGDDSLLYYSSLNNNNAAGKIVQPLNF